MNINPAAERFLVNICSAFGKRLSSETFTLYLERLSKWQQLTEQDWAYVKNSIVDNEENFPKIAEVLPYLRAAAAGHNRSRPTEPTWQLFTLHGRRYCRKVDDPMSQPSLPEGATDLHFVSPSGPAIDELSHYPVEDLVDAITEEVPF